MSEVLYTTFNIYVDLYKKFVTVNGHYLNAYVDTGSKINILNSLQCNTLQLKVMPSATVMRGFGGAIQHSLGTAYIYVNIDNVILEGFVEISNYKLPGIDLIIGQTMINQNNISLITTDKSVKFIKNVIIEEALCDIKLEISDFISKFSVHLKNNIVVRQFSFAYVNVYINDQRDVYSNYLVNSVYYELGDMAFISVGGIIRSQGCQLKLINVSAKCIEWPANKLVARAEIVKECKESITNTVLAVYQTIDSDRLELNNIQVGELSKNEGEQLLKLLNKYIRLFAKGTKDLGCTNLLEMHIETTTDQPVHYKPYRLSYKESEIVNEKVSDLLDAGIIRESMSDYASPVVLVKKKEVITDYVWTIEV